jgi:excisionase family DNA binding protein
MNTKMWNVKEVADFLGLSVGTIYHMVSQKRLPCVRYSARCLRFDPCAIEEWVAQQAEQPREFKERRKFDGAREEVGKQIRNIGTSVASKTRSKQLLTKGETK